jgi:hypothetical protein
MSVDTGVPLSAVPGGPAVSVATPTFNGSPVPGAGGGAPDPSQQVSDMTKKLLANIAQAAQRRQFAGTPVPAAVPGFKDPAEAQQIGMNTANPNAWGRQRLMAGVATNIQNAVAKQKQQKLLKAEADWSYMAGAMNDLEAAKSSGDPKAVASAQQKVDIVMGDPKKLKEMAKALNQDWLNPEKTTVYGEALKKVTAQAGQQAQSDAQKQQAAQGLKGMFQRLVQQRQQPQLSADQKQAMSREIQSKAPTQAAGLDTKALEAQEKILHDRATEALAGKKDELAAAYRKQEIAIQETRLAQEKEERIQRQTRLDEDMKLKEKTLEERTRHDKALESRAAAAGGGGGGDAKLIADAIKRGEQPPTTTGLYKLGPAVRAELARQNVPIARMETDYKATQRLMATMNGPQQTRLRQDISTVSDSLDKIDGLYTEWETLAHESGYRVLNHATMQTMKQLPGRAGAVAQALDAQIADTTAGLGTIYMGGNSPTDNSLKLAAHSLSADWNDETFREGLKQARENVKIRKNSIEFSQPAGMSGGNNPYMDKPPAAGAGGGAAGMETQTYNGATYQRKKGTSDQWTLVPK